jgi:hypothetical protein
MAGESYSIGAATQKSVRRPQKSGFFAPCPVRVSTGTMSVEVERATMPCNVCGAAVSELRRGRCWGCYTRWVESRPVGRGASCAVCHEKRRNMLKLVELKGRSLPFCHGCAAQVLRLVDVPETIDELRLVLRRERRDGDRREGEAVDQRIFPRERRVGERRGPSRDGYADTDPSMRLSEFEDVVIELAENDMEEVEQTQVRARPVAAAQPSVSE